MKLEFNTETAARTAHVQKQIEQAVLPFRENTEAAIVVLALIRVAKILLDLYSPKSRGELYDVIKLFLAGEEPIVLDTRSTRMLTKFKLN